MLLKFFILCGYLVASDVVYSAVIEQDFNSCSPNEFNCGDGTCVGLNSICDGMSDCAHGEDEQGCESSLPSLLVHDPVIQRSKRQAAGCRRDQWQCRDGTCISFDGKCDGAYNCPDGSDETHALCRNVPCQSNWFRCTYGACVDGTAPCNGIQECVDNSDELLPQCRNETMETNGSFKCADGSTIISANLCDGTRDCPDGSDETVRACAGNTCWSHLFQCAYGACVDQGSDCNNIQECADGSDEADELCNRTTTGTPIISSPDGKCVLPPYPEHGSYVAIGIQNAAPGQRYNNLQINVTCQKGYGVMGDSSVLCSNGWWPQSIPECVRFCKLNKHPSVDYYCLVTGKVEGRRICEEYEPSNTVVLPECKKPNYYATSYLRNMRCIDGSWDYVATCEAGLVKQGTNITILIKGKVEIYINGIPYVEPQPVSVESVIDEIDWRMGVPDAVNEVGEDKVSDVAKPAPVYRPSGYFKTKFYNHTNDTGEQRAKWGPNYGSVENSQNRSLYSYKNVYMRKGAVPSKIFKTTPNTYENAFKNKKNDLHENKKAHNRINIFKNQYEHNSNPNNVNKVKLTNSYYKIEDTSPDVKIDVQSAVDLKSIESNLFIDNNGVSKKEKSSYDAKNNQDLFSDKINVSDKFVHNNSIKNNYYNQNFSSYIKRDISVTPSSNTGNNISNLKTSTKPTIFNVKTKIQPDIDNVDSDSVNKSVNYNDIKVGIVPSLIFKTDFKTNTTDNNNDTSKTQAENDSTVSINNQRSVKNKHIKMGVVPSDVFRTNFETMWKNAEDSEEDNDSSGDFSFSVRPTNLPQNEGTPIGAVPNKVFKSNFAKNNNPMKSEFDVDKLNENSSEGLSEYTTNKPTKPRVISSTFFKTFLKTNLEQDSAEMTIQNPIIIDKVVLNDKNEPIRCNLTNIGIISNELFKTNVERGIKSKNSPDINIKESILKACSKFGTIPHNVFKTDLETVTEESILNNKRNSFEATASASTQSSFENHKNVVGDHSSSLIVSRSNVPSDVKEEQVSGTDTSDDYKSRIFFPGERKPKKYNENFINVRNIIFGFRNPTGVKELSGDPTSSSESIPSSSKEIEDAID